MRFLLCRTDGIGDLVVSLPVQGCILDKEPSAEIFWLVRQETVPILEHLPGVSGVLHRPPDGDLEQSIMGIKPDVLLNLGHRDKRIVPAARSARVPIRVARPRGMGQALCATHIVWAKRTGSGRHESQHALDFLKKLKWPVPDSIPPPPRLALTQEEIAWGRADIQNVPAPRLGAIVSGKTTGISPSAAWWETMLAASKRAGWSPIVLSPPDAVRCGPGTPDAGALPPTGMRGLMARLAACDAVLGVSTGPTHLAAALGVPTLCLMERDIRFSRDRWGPLGDRAGSLAYPGEAVELGLGMDRFSPDTVLEHLEKLRAGNGSLFGGGAVGNAMG
jgi:ADP-heptose:LPS heptosyltransferase